MQGQGSAACRPCRYRAFASVPWDRAEVTGAQRGLGASTVSLPPQNTKLLNYLFIQALKLNDVHFKTQLAQTPLSYLQGCFVVVPSSHALMFKMLLAKHSRWLSVLVVLKPVGSTDIIQAWFLYNKLFCTDFCTGNLITDLHCKNSCHFIKL